MRAESMTETKPDLIEQRAEGGPVGKAIQAFWRVLVRPGEFFGDMPGDGSPVLALAFLAVCSAVFSFLTGFLTPHNTPVATLIFFLNAMLTPFVLSLLLYGAAWLFCRGVFSFRTLFAVNAYASATLLLAWIPGASLPVGLWRFILVGMGLARTGGLSGKKACLVLCSAVFILLLLLGQVHSWLAPWKIGQ